MKSGRAGGATLCKRYVDCGKKRKRGLEAERGEGELESAAAREGVRGGESGGGSESDPKKESQTLTPAVWCVGERPSSQGH